MMQNSNGMVSTDEQYGTWPDYVEWVVSGVIWLRDPFCPGPEWEDSGEVWESQFIPNPFDHSKPLRLRKWVKREL